MGEKRFAKNPLLYIQQPTIGNPKAPMQHDYFTPKQEKVYTNKEELPKRKPLTRPRKRNFFLEEEQEDQEQALETEEAVIEKNKNNVEKKFKNMTLQEKVDYFVELPDHILKVRCELSTADRKYQGVITDFQDDYVFIRVGRRSTSQKVKFSDVKSIRLLGF